MEFEKTKSSYLQHKNKNRDYKVQIGKITKVYEHTAPDDRSNFEADVLLRDGSKNRRRARIAMKAKDEIDVPERGEEVLIDFLHDDDGEYPVVRGSATTDEDRPPLGYAGTWRKRHGHLYIESDKDGTWMRMGYRENPDTKEELKEPPLWVGMFDEKPNDTSKLPRAVVSFKGTKYDLLGPRINYSDSYIENAGLDPYPLGRFTLSKGRRFDVFSAELSEKEGKFPKGTELLVYDIDKGKEERSMFKQEPGTPDNSGWPSKEPIHVDSNYETQSNSLEKGRKEKREPGEPIYSLEAKNKDRTIAIQVKSVSGTELHAAINGQIGQLPESEVN